MLEKLKKAVPEKLKHSEILKDFEESSREVNGTVDQWKAMVVAWEEDPSKPNPYETISNGLSYFWRHWLGTD